VLVGYACERHSSDRQETPLWSSGNQQESAHQSDNEKNTKNPKPINSILSIPNGPRGVKISSTTALRALEEAQLLENEASTTGPDHSVLETASTQTSVESDVRLGSTYHGMPNHGSILDDLRARLRKPSQYIASLLELEEKIWKCSTLGVRAMNEEFNVSYPLIPSELQDIIPNRLSDDPFAMDPTNTSDEEITMLCQATADLVASSHLNAIRVCRNVMLRTFLNLKLLRQSNFCGDRLSVIVLDTNRRDVAKLLPIEYTDLYALMFELEYILRDSASLVLNSITTKEPPNIDQQFEFLRTPIVNQYCLSLLQISPESLPVLTLGTVRKKSYVLC
jgi:hypothetical protein